jgi:arylsulfatase A-like enzyme
VARGKKLADIDRVPAFWPDNETIRNDILDYAVEVEHFDSHLARLLDSLEKRGLLENTLVVATSDHGMPFPRCKGQAYNYSNHVPMAIMWPKGLKKPERVVSDYVSFIDIAPTFLEVAGVKWENSGMADSPGRSLTDILFSEKEDRVNPERNYVLIGKERHDIGRPQDGGYPIRGIVKNQILYIKNYETDRWPACNPETGYLNCDGSPTKTIVLQGRTQGEQKKFWDLCFGKKPAEELYDLNADPDCVHNLAGSTERAALKQQLADQLNQTLRAQADPRMFGKGHLFDEYLYSNPGTRNFYERYMKGEKLNAGWVNPTDFEKQPLD